MNQNVVGRTTGISAPNEVRGAARLAATATP